MKKRFIFLLALATVSVAMPVLATTNSFYGTIRTMKGEGKANWIAYGGCDTGCYDYNASNDPFYPNGFYTIGDYNVKQGFYQLSTPLSSSDNDKLHGKLSLAFDYRFITNEAKDSTSKDYGLVKLKNVETNKVYYQLKLTPANGSITNWTTVRVPLSINLATKELQLVVEAYNDDNKLTTLHINRVRFDQKSEPQITGKVTYQDSGKTFAATEASVVVTDLTTNAVVLTTTTNSDGMYTAFPLVGKHEYTVTATLNDLSGSITYPTALKWGTQAGGNIKLQ